MTKRTVSIFCALGACAVACLAGFGGVASDAAALRGAVEDLAVQGLSGDAPGNAEYIRKKAGKAGLSQQEALAEMASMAREYRRMSEEGVDKWEDEWHNGDATRCLRVLQLIACFGDRSTLPLFEEMAVASNVMIRSNGYIGYIKVAGTDSVPFLRKILSEPVLNPLDKKRVFRGFGDQIRSSKAANPEKDLGEQYAFLLEMATVGPERQCILDEILCDVLPDYRTSLQREMFAEGLSRSGNEYQKDVAHKIKAEIEKTPKAKRKDFSAKGGLLDPNRKKGQEAAL